MSAGFAKLLFDEKGRLNSGLLFQTASLFRFIDGSFAGSVRVCPWPLQFDEREEG